MKMFYSEEFKKLSKDQFIKNKIGWKKSFFEGLAQDEQGNELPWMTYPAIDFLQKNINQNHEIFEFGCGTSTLFFAKKAKAIVSLETNAKWLEIVKQRLDKLQPKIRNTEIFLMKNGLENEDYQNFAKNFSKNSIEQNRCGKELVKNFTTSKFDFIIIDSLKRFECVQNSLDALKSDGAIILDDSQRASYQKIFKFLAERKFSKQDFFGIAPGQLKVKNTTFFFRTNATNIKSSAE